MLITRRHLRRLIRETISETLGDKPQIEEVSSAGTLIIDGDDILVLRAYRNWGFPKGGVDPGESLRDAAIRETAEETGLEIGKDYELTEDVAPSIRYKSRKKDKETGKSVGVIKTATFFVARRTSKKEVVLLKNPELGRPEHDESDWIPISSLGNTDPEAGIVFAPRLTPVLSYLTSYVEGGNKEDLSEPQLTPQDAFDKAVLDGGDPMDPDLRAKYPDVESLGTEAAEIYFKKKFDWL